MCAPSPPPPPDYAQIAREQGAANREAALQQGIFNNPNISNPYGSRVVNYTQGEGDLAGYWIPTIEDQLTPEGQSLFDLQQRISGRLGGMAEDALGRVEDSFANPFSFAGMPEMVSGDGPADYVRQNRGQIQTGLDLSGLGPIVQQLDLEGMAGISMPDFSGVGDITTGIDMGGISGWETDLRRYLRGLPEMQYEMGDAGEIQREFGDAGPLYRNLNFENMGDLATEYDYSGLTGLQDADEATRTSIVNSIIGRFEPRLLQDEENKRAELVARGFRPGTEAWQRELDQLGRNRSDFYLGANLAGGQEMRNLWDMSMGNRRQTWQEAMAQGDFHNAALLQQQERRVADELTRGQFANQAQQQAYEQARGRAAFSNEAQQQTFEQMLQEMEFENQQRGVGIEQGIAQANFANQARQMQVAERAALAQFANQAQAQQFGQARDAAAAMNAAQGQDYQQRFNTAAFQNQANQQGYQQQLGAGIFANAAQAQQNQQAWGDVNQYNAMQENARNRAIQEALMLRNMPLDELNRARTGAQFQVPNFGQPSGASVQPSPVFGAAQAQNADAMARYNAGVGTSNQAMSGLFSLGAAALGSSGFFPWLAGLAGSSDRRLKSDIRRVGTHPLGIGIYSYTIRGQRELGVMADEVLAVRPEAVLRGADGYLMVNYGVL